MIGRLQGILLEKQPPHLLLDVQGVGYEILAPMSTFYRLPDLRQQVVLLTHLVVREDAHLLYGFIDLQERSLFRALIKVNGVGPKLALAILSGMEAQEFVRCVLEQNALSLVNIPGIGKKTAERLIIETRDALAHWQLDSTKNFPEQSENFMVQNQAQQDALAALAALGYKPQEAKQALLKIKDPQLNSEELIRLVLKQMMKGISS